MVPNEPLTSQTAGFEGEISGLGLSEIIQLNALTQFSGCIEIENGHRMGLVFLRDGAIVHAEQGDLSGEEAFYEMVSWPGGRFTLQENVATTCSTIKKSCQFLLLEAHRLLDERRARPAAPASRATVPLPARGEAQAPAPGPASTAAALLERLRAIPGVAAVALQPKGGGRVAGDGYGAEVLGGQALYVAMIAGQLAQRLRAGELYSAVVQGTTGHLLLVAVKHHYVAVLAHADVQVGGIEAEVRRILSGAR